MPATAPLPFPVAAGTRLLGEVISWTCSGVSVTHPALLTALRDAGLDEGVARELAAKHAFTRACKKLCDRRIIRQVGEDDATVRFQFTQESRDGDRYEYALETMLTLDKKTGTVTCDLPGLATLAQEELDRATDARTGSDVTRVIQKLFDRHADLFPIRPQGGCYFTPIRHAAFVDKVQAMLGRLNGQILRFPVPAGTAEGDRSVKDAVAAGLAALIDDHRRAVAQFGEDKQADWCDYRGTVVGEEVGVALMADPGNVRRAWFHARDYGVLVANPFGRRAFTKGEESRIVVKAGETFRLRFGVLVHSGKTDVGAAYAAWRPAGRTR